MFKEPVGMKGESFIEPLFVALKAKVVGWGAVLPIRTKTAADLGRSHNPVYEPGYDVFERYDDGQPPALDTRELSLWEITAAGPYHNAVKDMLKDLSNQEKVDRLMRGLTETMAAAQPPFNSKLLWRSPEVIGADERVIHTWADVDPGMGHRFG